MTYHQKGLCAMTDYKHYLRVSPTGRMDIKTFDPATDVNDVIHDELDGAL